MSDQSSKNTRCGVVSIVGRPNVGKSTLINTILGEKISIVTAIPQTTRNQIRGIYNDERGQIIFIDTPGLHHGQDQLDKFMNQSSAGTLSEVDCIIYLVDISREIGTEERNVAEKVAASQRPVIMGLNKVDLKKDLMPTYISFWEEVKGKKVTELEHFTLMAMSGKMNKNIDELINVIYENLPEGPPLYPTDIITDTPQRMVISDIIREKLFLIMKDEIPHALGVMIESIQNKRNKGMIIKALILVERDTQKEIVIGKNGSNLKKIGTEARHELEDLLEKKIFLELFVKTQKRWRDNQDLLIEQGYADL